MIPFDIKKMAIEHVWLKSSTTALGGSITVVDEMRTSTKKETYKKIAVPAAVARKFAAENNKTTKYLRPVLTAVTKYDGHVVALERHPLGSIGTEEEDGLFGKRVWVSESEKNLENIIAPITNTGEWYIDGSFIYNVNQDNIKQAENLSSDGRFRSIQVQALKLSCIHQRENIQPAPRTCLQYVAPTGEMALTSPIWKQLGKIGSSQLEEDEQSYVKHQFDRIDEHLVVNLSFALKAGKEISELFGYDAIEPLQLDNLMIRFRTVNLPKIPKAVKQTCDVGLPFTHAVAWLIGLIRQTESLESYMVVRSLLKYLTTKGIYKKNAFDPSSVFKDGMSLENVPLKNTNDQSSTDDLSIAEYIQASKLFNRREDEHNPIVGTLYGAE